MKKSKRKNLESGFSLVELMIAVLLSMIAMIGIYRSFTAFSTSADRRDQMIELQQNLRIGLDRMTREIIKAGYDPTGSGNFGLVIGSCGSDTIKFTFDDDWDGVEEATDGNGVVDAGETITFNYDTANNSLDRTVDAGTPQSVSENVSGLEFIYITADGSAAAVTNTTRNVQISLVVRSTNEDYSYTDDMTFKNLQGDTLTLQESGGALPTPANDHYHRRLLASEVFMRNLEL